MLWRKVRAGLSAGRVQSVATRLVVERERERMAFRSASYWDIVGTFDAGAATTSGLFPARLLAVDGARVAARPRLRRPRRADGVRTVRGRRPPGRGAAPTGARRRRCTTPTFAVRSRRGEAVHPASGAPFTTSTLQQEASRKLRFSLPADDAVAQTLYENGYITYMRTDSTNAVRAGDHGRPPPGRASCTARTTCRTGRASTPTRSKNAQEAHEAIRPAGDAFRTPAQVSGSCAATSSGSTS